MVLRYREIAKPGGDEQSQAETTAGEEKDISQMIDKSKKIEFQCKFNHLPEDGVLAEYIMANGSLRLKYASANQAEGIMETSEKVLYEKNLACYRGSNELLIKCFNDNESEAVVIIDTVNKVSETNGIDLITYQLDLGAAGINSDILGVHNYTFAVQATDFDLHYCKTNEI